MQESPVPANQEASAPEAAPEKDPLISIDDFAKLDLRTGEILEVTEHPNADKLYLMQVQVGDEKKQIVAGVKAYFTPEELVGKTIIVVNNLKPAKLRGEQSQGMMLAVRNGDELAVLTPSKPLPSGLRVS